MKVWVIDDFGITDRVYAICTSAEKAYKIALEIIHKEFDKNCEEWFNNELKELKYNYEKNNSHFYNNSVDVYSIDTDKWTNKYY